MKKLEKTNGLRALNGALDLSQPGGNGNGVTHGNPDELSPMPEQFAGLYQAGYDAGYAGGKEAGYRQGYQAGFEDGRRQGGDGINAAPAAVEKTVVKSEVGKSEFGNTAGMRKARLFGMPCTKCRKWFFSDEARCPRCATPRITSAGPASTTRGD